MLVRQFLLDDEFCDRTDGAGSPRHGDSEDEPLGMLAWRRSKVALDPFTPTTPGHGADSRCVAGALLSRSALADVDGGVSSLGPKSLLPQLAST